MSRDKKKVILGLDSGSTGLKVAILDAASRELMEVMPYIRHHNKYEQHARKVLTGLQERFTILHLSITGSTGAILARSWPSTKRVPEVQSHALGARSLNTEIEAVIDGGGAEIKFFKIDSLGRTYDFAMNPECASGSGNFLDVQANRLNLYIDEKPDESAQEAPPQNSGKITDVSVSAQSGAPDQSVSKHISPRDSTRKAFPQHSDNTTDVSVSAQSGAPDHFPTMGLEAIIQRKTVSISGRCSVFAKSDMIHHQQKAVSVEAIVGGLHESMVGNIKATVLQNRLRNFKGLLAFQGGLSLNATLRHCISMQLGLESKQFFMHKYGYAAGAIGAALSDNPKIFEPDDISVTTQKHVEHHTLPPLTDNFINERGEIKTPVYDLTPLREITNSKTTPPIRAYVGIDIGSVSTNIVLIENESERVIAKYYGPTMGRPIEAMKEGFKSITRTLGETLGADAHSSFDERLEFVNRAIKIDGVCTTGSGRFMVGHFVNSDSIRNEITAQAVGAVRTAAQAGLTIDTIFEIGGQDSKYIKLDADGGVRDYTMNKVCAAGCGSFLEEQAEKLAINIKQEFSDLALKSSKPADLGDRCTVFIESVMDNLAGEGEAREDLIAGLAYSVANNYLNRVVEGRDTEGNIFFQGGTAFNTAVVRAFANILDKPIWVTPHNEVTGAVGAACLAKDWVNEKRKADENYQTSFGGIAEQIEKTFESKKRVCRSCANHCELQVVSVTEHDEKGETKKRNIYYGDRCDEMNLLQGKKRTRTTDNLLSARNKIIFNRTQKELPKEAKVIGIPRSLSMWSEHYALWHTLFTELGLIVVLSNETSKKTIMTGAGLSLADYCVPVRTAHGAVNELLSLTPKVDYIFAPHLVTYDKRNKKSMSYACLWTQTLPIALKEAFDFDKAGVTLLSPILELERKETEHFELIEHLSAKLNLPASKIKQALAKGFKEFHKARRQLVELGQDALSNISSDNPAFLLVGRGYNAFDPGLSLDIATKLERIGHKALPMDLLPLEELPLVDDPINMYWKNGERILSALAYAAKTEGLIPVWITNFGCGPDSFIRKQAKRVMGDAPFLELELDEHTADAGVITRIEAFYESYRNKRAYVHKMKMADNTETPHQYDITGSTVALQRKTLLFNNMNDGSLVVAATFRSRGFDARALPRTTPESLALGKKYSSGKECVPYQTTLGDKLHFLTSGKQQYQVYPDELVSPTKEQMRNAEDITFFEPYASGPCRFGQYLDGYKRVYEELGIKAHMLSSSAHNNYADFFKNQYDLMKFVLVSADAITAADILRKVKQMLRPVAEIPDEVTKIYNSAMRKLIDKIEQKGTSIWQIRNKLRAINRILKKAASEFASVVIDPEKEANVANVGLFGEIYVRAESFINEEIVTKLEHEGIRAYTASMMEWFTYVNYNYLWDCRTKEKRFYGGFTLNPLRLLGRLFFRRHQLDSRIKRYYLPSRVRKLSRPFRHLSGWIDDPNVEDTIKAGEAHVPFNIKGELILSWGLARELQHDSRFHGIVNIGPFGCMPSKVVSNLLHNEEITKPVFDATYDGSLTASRALKIETFASGVRSYAHEMKTTGHGTEVDHGKGKQKERSKGQCDNTQNRITTTRAKEE